MLDPKTIRAKEFSRSMRGYTPAEVDEHVAFLLQQYTAAYTRIGKLEAELTAATIALSDYQRNDAVIREARERADAEIASARAEAERIHAATRDACTRLIVDARKLIKAEREKIARLSSLTESFKVRLVEFYREQGLYVRDNIPTLDPSEYTHDDDVFMQDLLEQIAIDQRAPVMIPLVKKTPSSPPVAASVPVKPAPQTAPQPVPSAPQHVPPKSAPVPDKERTQVFGRQEEKPKAAPTPTSGETQVFGEREDVKIYHGDSEKTQHFTGTFDFREITPRADNTVEFARPKKK